MGKKKKNVVIESNAGIDIKSLIHENSMFFDKLVELIPAKFYLPNDDKDKPWFQGLSKGKKAEAKKVSRENIKKARRERLDPEKSATTLDLLMQNLRKDKENDESDGEEVEVNTMVTGLDGDDKRVTYEELRQRLHRKIEELRGGRNSSGSERAKKRNERKQIYEKKRKREFGYDDKKPGASAASVQEEEKKAEDAVKELKFSHVKIGDDDEQQGKKKKKKLSKLKELEKAKELEEAKKDPAKGMKHSWSAATSRAAGIKVHDNPTRLKQSIQKEKKRRQKNAEKWKERAETQQKTKAEKQQTRSQNISERAQQKKMRRIEKREKKLMRTGSGASMEGNINGSAS